ncbi:uncharacterized protein [Drosophila virilis]|uniref:Uncharacterized protein, isoform A n=1 Tax=Drosophila virilis TaxID=7244 RepID=B4LZ21_DROVI|nr:uncharacterized protein LOC6630539 isoform X2 [Drosophila virilis]EDW68124.1 uncharacterized protein Dvir_GJ24545, isoform A [Drosophila virilis]
MSNLQDVPLAEPEDLPTIEQDTAGSKSNSLKRFFKLGKKSNTSQEASDEVTELEDEANKDPAKPGSISRLLTRLKGNSKTEQNEPTSSNNETAVEEAADKPVPNLKPTIKTSISGYWKQLFHRQKVANRQEQKSATDQETIELQDEPQESMEPQQTDSINAEEGPTTAAAEALREDIILNVPEKTMDNQTNCIPEIIEEVQMLAISDEIADPSNDDNKK